MRSRSGSERGPENLGTLGLEHFVEARNVLGGAVADQELGGDVRSGEIAGHVSGTLGDPRSVGISGHPSDPDPCSAKLDEEQDIEAFEQNGVDMEEVRSHYARRLGAQALTPGWTTSAGSRIEAVVLDDPGDGARRKTYAELAQFTLDAP